MPVYMYENVSLEGSSLSNGGGFGGVLDRTACGKVLQGEQLEWSSGYKSKFGKSNVAPHKSMKLELGKAITKYCMNGKPIVESL